MDHVIIIIMQNAGRDVNVYSVQYYTYIMIHMYIHQYVGCQLNSLRRPRRPRRRGWRKSILKEGR